MRSTDCSKLLVPDQLRLMKEYKALESVQNDRKKHQEITLACFETYAERSNTVKNQQIKAQRDFERAEAKRLRNEKKYQNRLKEAHDLDAKMQEKQERKEQKELHRAREDHAATVAQRQKSERRKRAKED